MQSSLLGRAVFLCWEMQDAGRAEIPASVVTAVLWGQKEEDGASPDLLQPFSRPSPDLLQASPWAGGS